MSDILVIKVNMFCRSRELNDIRRYILSQVENSNVVVLPAYCEAQIVPDDMEIQVEDLSGEQVGKELERIKQEATDDAVNTAMVLLLTLPLEVLMDHYWTKTYAKRIPRFTELVLEYYERWQNGELDMDKLKEDLWEYGGVKLVEGEGETA